MSEKQILETCFNYYYERFNNHNIGWFSSNETRFITKIHKLKEQYPDLVNIIKEPEDNDGTIYCSVPQRWLKITPPRAISDEQRAALSANAKQRWSATLPDNET